MDDCCADAEERAGFGGDVAGEADSGADVDTGADHGFVVDDAAGVEDGVVADLAVGADEGAGGDDDTSSHRGIGGELGRGVDGVDEFEAELLDDVGHGAADAVVADGDDGAGDSTFTKVVEAFESAEDGHSIDTASVEGLVVVEESDRLVVVSLSEDIENNPAVASCSKDGDIHDFGILFGGADSGEVEAP